MRDGLLAPVSVPLTTPGTAATALSTVHVPLADLAPRAMAPPRPSASSPVAWLAARRGIPVGRNLTLLAGTAFCLSFGMAAQNAVGSNFQVETLGMTAADRGLMEGGREVPGLLLAFISALAAAVPLPLLAAAMLAMMALQYFSFFFVSDVWQLIALVMFGSVGFHMWMPLSRELNLSQADKTHAGRVLGFMAGTGSAGALLGMLTVFASTRVMGCLTCPAACLSRAACSPPS